MEIEEAIANSKSNQDHLVLALQEKLRDFGLTKNESRIYIFLSKNGPKKQSRFAEKKEFQELKHIICYQPLNQKELLQHLFKDQQDFLQKQ